MKSSIDTEGSKRLESHPRALRMFLSLEGVAIVGAFDYLTGFELNFFAFYLVPVSLAVWYVSRGFGIFVAALSVAVSVSGDFIAGARYSSPIVPVWNIAISLTFYLVVVWILDKLRTLHNELEERVRQRTADLNKEMQDRVQLEEEILSISEREQQRIGRDLHDSLSQHLTGVALAGEVLREQLAAKALPEAKAMDHIVKMVEGAIDLTRTLAHGLHPLDLSGEGFTDALRELAATIDDGFKTRCTFECDSPVEIEAAGVATHLYRIAQEAVTNAVKHSKARNIVLRLEGAGGGLTLTISDDGVGVPPKMPMGMGLRTMAYRASVIGATFTVERLLARGTRVTCNLPDNGITLEPHGAKS
jgi:signal transduction histidine kinase